TADGSEKWSYSLDHEASHLTTPVAGVNGLSYFGVDEKLYVFKDIGTPVSDKLGLKGPISQPVIDKDDVLYVVQGTEVYTVSRDGTSRHASVTVPGLTTTVPVKPVMDGAGNLFIIDNQNKFFVFTSGLQSGNSPQALPLVFGGS